MVGPLSLSTYSFHDLSSLTDFLCHASGAFQLPSAWDNSFKETLASPITDEAMCLFASNLETFIEINLNSGFSKLAHEPVVKSASLVPIAIARSVCFARLFAALPPSPPIGPRK